MGKSRDAMTKRLKSLFRLSPCRDRAIKCRARRVRWPWPQGDKRKDGVYYGERTKTEEIAQARLPALQGGMGIGDLLQSFSEPVSSLVLCGRRSLFKLAGFSALHFGRGETNGPQGGGDWEGVDVCITGRGGGAAG